MPKQTAFNGHEAALLLDAYLRVLSGEKSRMASIQECSTQLRQMALNTGKHIDDIYRNVNGITFQMSSMESAYQGQTIIKPATRLFTQVVDLFRNDTKQYQRLLMEAKEMAKTKEDSEAVFMSWLSENVSGAQLSELYMALHEIEVQAKKDKLIKQSLYEKLDPTSIMRVKNGIEGSRIFKYTHKRLWNRILLALDYLMKYSVQEFSIRKPVIAERTASNTTSASKDSAVESVEKDSDFYEQGRDRVEGENSKSAVFPTVKGDRESFFRWLRDDQHMAEATCRSYISAINCAERFAKERGLDSVKLYTSDPQEARATVNELYAHQGFLRYNDDQNNRFRVAITKLLVYYRSDSSQVEPQTVNITDERWLFILKNFFPDGYILDDFLSRFQAVAFWQERYSESCPVEGDAIDEAMKAIGTIRDDRVFANKVEDRALISSICEEINNTLSQYSAVYRANIYSHYQEQLASCQIYTEEVMTQQLLNEANGRFYSYYQCFVKQGQEASVTNDARKVLRNHGGAMSVGDVTNELWFIPYDIVYHCLAADEEAISIGNSVWMLAENFPLTEEDAKLVGNMLEECFLSQNFVKAQELIPLLKQHLPSIADNLSGLHFTAVFNILSYYLKNRFSFSRAIISPKGVKTELQDLFRGFAKEHEQFTLDELSAFASDLKVPIYWESTFNGGAVRVSRTEFVNRSQISFDVTETDVVLESFCTGDYLPLQDISSAMMMHLPSCGYRWNGYLLLSYLYGYSKMFKLFYNSLGKSGYYGALVKRSCAEIDCYERLVERVLIQDHTWQTEDEALDVLIDKGLQAQRRFKGINQIVVKVRNSRIQEEGEEVFA